MQFNIYKLNINSNKFFDGVMGEDAEPSRQNMNNLRQNGNIKGAWGYSGPNISI